MGDSIEYGDVVQEIRGAMNPGRLRLQSNAVIFKNIKTGKVENMSAEDIDEVKWLLRARGHCLKFMLKNGSIHRFDGLKEAEFDKLNTFITKYYNTGLSKVDMSLKGWNWGTAKFKGSGLNFIVSNSEAFEIPLNNVSNASTSKNEVTLEFHQNDDAAVSLMELRFHIPTDSNMEVDPVAEFHKNVLDKADIIQATGESIATFTEIQCLTPRGRYDIKIYSTFLQLHGKTFDYKIPYTTILRLFLLPHKDGRQMFFVVSLDPPIKQGQTRYPFLILLFNKEEEITLELHLSEEQIQEKYEGKLMKEMSGPEYEIVSRIMKTLVNKKITVPGSFIGCSGSHAVGCSYKAATGFLYPLERGFIFVHKPPVHIRFDEIGSVNFARSSGNTRSFDFDVETKQGTVYNFSSIEKDEYGKMYEFCSQKKLRVKNIGDNLQKKNYKEDMMEESSDEGQHDAYLERMKAEGKQVEIVDDEEDSDDSSDESFAPDNLSASEVDLEWDSNATETPSSQGESDSDYTGGEGGGEKKEKPKKEKKEKKEKKVRTVKEPGQKRKRRTKKDHDPDRPKRAQSAYMLWLADHREQIKEENPGISITDLTKKAGEMWRSIGSEDKKKYEEMYAKAKEEYEEAMKVYKEKVKERGPSSPSPKGKKSKSKSPRKPVSDTAGSGANYKSKEFVSDSESSSGSSDDSDKPLKKKPKKEKPQKKDESDEGSSGNEAEMESDSE